MSIHEEIKRRRLKLGWSHQRLADEVSQREGLTKPLAWQTIQQWEAEDGTAPKRKRLAHVAAALGATLPEMLGSDQDQSQTLNGQSQAQRQMVSVDGDQVIHQFDTGGAMGGGLVLQEQPGVIQSWHVTPEWLNLNVKKYTTRGNLCIVTGFGDSMKPLYNPGDPLLVDTGVKIVDFEGVYFFRLDNEGFIKRLQRIQGVLHVISDNKKYKDWTIAPANEDFEVFGRVLKVWRSEEL